VGARAGSDFQNLHRNKRCMQIDLKHPDGHAAFMRLVQTADAVIENMRPDVKRRLRIAWEDVHASNPRVVYGSISGFGQDGPYSARAGLDQIAQGMGGLMSITGVPGQGPMRTGIAVSDMTAGNLLAMAVMIALFERTSTGIGRWVTTSLLEAQIFMLDFQAARYLMAGDIAGQAGNDHPTIIPMGVFPASDGYINIAAGSQRLFVRLCDTLGHPEWAERPDWRTYADRLTNRAALNEAISAVTRAQPAAYWIEVFEEAGVPCGPIYNIGQVFADAQVKHLGVATKLPGGAEVLASPITISGIAKAAPRGVPGANEHAIEILREIGFTESDIDRLHQARAISRS
jgi:formyl-CoA transferase